MDTFDDKSYYINRELSWLSFNERVLGEAVDNTNPLFERLKFIAITCSNMDEFFMVRVAGLKDQIKMGYNRPENKTQMTPVEQLREITKRVHNDVAKVNRLLVDTILPALASEGIEFLRAEHLTDEQAKYVADYYHHHVFPVLTPLAVDASHPFPMLSNRSLNIAVRLISEDDDLQEQLLAVVQVPSVLSRYIQLPSPSERLQFILLEDVIQIYTDSLFPGNRVIESAYFRITRNADMIVDEESAEDLLEEIEKELKKRNRGAAVRLEVAQTMEDVLVDTLRDWLELEEEDIYTIRGPLDPTFFMKFYSVPGFNHLRFEELIPQPPRDLIGENRIFEAIARKDVMVFHPYESFDLVVHFINQAADDPNVLAIKQTLYRVSGHSPVVSALARAAENGKQVTVLLELKARFDEENNIVWAKKLEEAGCHVIYGLYGLKTHSKITLVVRKEGQQIRRYVHLSTGNYNDSTARIYTDIGVFTAREDFGLDASAFFNHLTGYGTTPEWKQISTAPHGLKEKFLSLIDREIEFSTHEKPGHIIAKMNSLTDKDMIVALYKASNAGVHIDLIVRGICCLRPGIPRVSENIRVFSIVGRFLEHSRIFYFQNDETPLYFLSSADWMTRNMSARVEILFPVVQDNLKRRLKHILEMQLNDTVNRYELHANRAYTKVQPGDESAPIASQLFFYEEAQAQLVSHHLGPITPKKKLVVN